MRWYCVAFLIALPFIVACIPGLTSEAGASKSIDTPKDSNVVDFSEANLQDLIEYTPDGKSSTVMSYMSRNGRYEMRATMFSTSPKQLFCIWMYAKQYQLSKHVEINELSKLSVRSSIGTIVQQVYIDKLSTTAAPHGVVYCGSISKTKADSFRAKLYIKYLGMVDNKRVSFSISTRDILFTPGMLNVKSNPSEADYAKLLMPAIALPNQLATLRFSDDFVRSGKYEFHVKYYVQNSMRFTLNMYVKHVRDNRFVPIDALDGIMVRAENRVKLVDATKRYDGANGVSYTATLSAPLSSIVRTKLHIYYAGKLDGGVMRLITFNLLTKNTMVFSKSPDPAPSHDEPRLVPNLTMGMTLFSDTQRKMGYVMSVIYNARPSSNVTVGVIMTDFRNRPVKIDNPDGLVIEMVNKMPLKNQSVVRVSDSNLTFSATVDGALPAKSKLRIKYTGGLAGGIVKSMSFDFQTSRMVSVNATSV